MLKLKEMAIDAYSRYLNENRNERQPIDFNSFEAGFELGWCDKMDKITNRIKEAATVADLINQEGIVK